MYLEAYSRRDNIKFENILEEDKEDTEKVLRTFLETELGFSDAANVDPDPYWQDSFDIRTVERFLRWDNVYGEQTTKCTCTKIFLLRSLNIGELRWKLSKRQDAT